MQVTLTNATTGAGNTAHIESYASTAEGKIYDDDTPTKTVSVATLASTVTEGDDGVTKDVTFIITRADISGTGLPEEYVSYNVEGMNKDSADSKDFLQGYGIVPSYTATDASGATGEFTYMYDTVAGQKDPLLWQQQSIGLRDGESQDLSLIHI